MIFHSETGNQLALQCARNKLCNLNVGESQWLYWKSIWKVEPWIRSGKTLLF